MELLRLNIQMFADEEAFVRCGSHCKHPAYTKEQVNALLADELKSKKEKSDFALIEETITVSTDGNGIVTVDFPEGFTKDNCIVLSADVKSHEENTSFLPREYNLGYGGTNFHKINPTVYLGDPSTYDSTKICISLYYGTLDQEIPKDVRVVLMKVGE